MHILTLDNQTNVQGYEELEIECGRCEISQSNFFLHVSPAFNSRIATRFMY